MIRNRPANGTTAGSWMHAILLGWLVGLVADISVRVLLVALVPIVLTLDPPDFVWESICGFVEGAAIGGLLLLYLGRRWSLGREWVVVTAIGWGVGMRVIDLTYHGLRWALGESALPSWEQPDHPLLWVVAITLGAVVFAISQWWVLRRVTRKAWRMIPGVAAAGIGAGATIEVLWRLISGGFVPPRDLYISDVVGFSILCIFWYFIASVGVALFGVLSGMAVTHVAGLDRRAGTAPDQEAA